MSGHKVFTSWETKVTGARTIVIQITQFLLTQQLSVLQPAFVRLAVLTEVNNGLKWIQHFRKKKTCGLAQTWS